MPCDSFAVKTWLHQVGKSRRKIFLKQLKNDLEERGLTQQEVYKGLLQLITTSPYVRLTRYNTLVSSHRRSSAGSNHKQDRIDVGDNGSPETPSSLSVPIDECVPPKAKRAKNDTDGTSTITEAPELLDERVGNAAFLVRIPRTAITLNLNSYISVSSKKNLSPPRSSPEIRVADSSVPDVSPTVDNNHNTSKKCDSSTVAKKPKIIEDVTCIEGTILSTTSRKQCRKDSGLSSEKSLQNSTIPRKKCTFKTRCKEIFLEEIEKNCAGADRRKKSSGKIRKNSISTSKEERREEKMRILFGNDPTNSECDEERKLIAKLTSRKRRKESRMSSDSGVCLTELTSESMTSEVHDKLDDEILFEREEKSAICADKLVKSTPLSDCAILATSNAIITPQEALPDSSTCSEEKSSIRPDSSSYDQMTIPVPPLNTQDSNVCDPLQLDLGSSNETQLSTPTSTTSYLPIDTPTKNDTSFEDLKILIGMDLKTGCHIDMQGNRISIQENTTVIEEDSMSCYNDDENPLVIDEHSCSDDFAESLKDGNQIIDASVIISNVKEISTESELHRDPFVPHTLDVDLASETIEKTSISLDEKIPCKLLNNLESHKDIVPIDENQNNTSLNVTNSSMKTNYKETSVFNGILSQNLPVSSADKAASKLIPETASNAELISNTNVEVDNIFKQLTSDLVQIDAASERERQNENPNKNINNVVEWKLQEPIMTMVDETKASRTMSEELPDSELPIFLVAPQKTKEIPKMSTFRVLHPTELGARWCPTPVNANVTNQSQLQQSSIPLVQQVSSNPLITLSPSNVFETQSSSNPAMTQNSSNPMMTQNSSSPLIIQSSSNSLMQQSSSYQLNNTNQLPLPTINQIQLPSFQFNSMQQLPMNTIVETSQLPSYSSISRIAQTLPTTSTRAVQPPPYSSIPQELQRPPVVMMRAPVPTSLAHLHHMVNTTLLPNHGATDLSSKNSALNRFPDRRPQPAHTGIAGPNNHYIRPLASLAGSGGTVNFRQQSSATSVPSNSYRNINRHSIVNQHSILTRICDLLLNMSWRLERLDKEHEMYKIFQLHIVYNEKLELLVPELEKYAKAIGTRDRRIIVNAIVRYYEELVEPGQRMLNMEKVVRIFDRNELLLHKPPSQSSIQPIFSEAQLQTLRGQIAIYKQLTRILHYQLLAQNEAAAEVERLKKVEAAKSKRIRRKRTTAVQDQSNIQIVDVTLPAREHINYQQTIESTIERILREDTGERNNVPVNVNEGVVNGNNIQFNNFNETVQQQSIDNTVAENLREIFRQHPVAKNPQDNSIKSNARDKSTETDIQDKTIENNLRDKSIETTIQDKSIESNLQGQFIATNVQDNYIENNIRDKVIETNVQDQGYDKPIESNSHVQIFEKEQTTPVKSISEKSYSSIDNGNTSVLDVLIEFDVLDSMTKGRASEMSKCLTNGKAAALTESKKCSKETEVMCPEVLPVPILNLAPSTESSDPKTETLKNVTSGSKPAESVKPNCGSSAIVSTIEKVVEKNDEPSTQVPEISEVVETNNGSTRRIPVITIDDEDNLNAASIGGTSIRRNADIVDIDGFNILEVKSISKDVFNQMGDVTDETVLADQTGTKLVDDNDTANECVDSKTEGSNCFNCDAEITLACERCRAAFYCSTKCHQEHWSANHHLECKRASTECENSARD